MNKNKNELLLIKAQEYATDFLKRRWPNRYIGIPIISIKDCVKGLIETESINKIVVDGAGQKTALVHWFLSRIEYKDKKNSATSAMFYKSAAWRKIRYSVINENGGVCSKCGLGVKDGIPIHVDHIKPRSKYPELSLEPSNLRVLCEDCNLGKSDSEIE